MALWRDPLILHDSDGISHSVEVTAATLFEAAATAIAAFREQGWAAHALTANAILHIDVHRPPMIYDVPLRAIERWAAGTSISPKEELAKRKVRVKS